MTLRNLCHYTIHLMMATADSEYKVWYNVVFKLLLYLPDIIHHDGKRPLTYIKITLTVVRKYTRSINIQCDGYLM